MLLTRKQFRELALKRDNYQCVVCKSKIQLSIHHLIEKDLFTFDDEREGYFLDNAVTVCENCHYKAEQTLISVEELRTAANIKNIILPHCLDNKYQYDKWGNRILSNGQRCKGLLFYLPNVQKVLKIAKVIDLFIENYEYLMLKLANIFPTAVLNSEKNKDNDQYWALDLSLDDKWVVVQYKPGSGYGVSYITDNSDFEAAPDWISQDIEDAILKVKEFLN